MSVCPFCKNYTKHLNKITAEPDFPRGVRDSGGICRDCKKAITSVSSDDECDWCGSDGPTIRVYNVSGEDMRQAAKRVHKVGSLCFDCLNIAEGDYPRQFSENKKKARERDDYECQRCGMPQEDHKDEFNQKLHVHHVDGDKRNNSLDNLKTLCARCHGAV